MAATEVISLVIEIGTLLVDPVWRQINYFRKDKEYVAKLESDELTLKDEIVKLEHTVADAGREGKEIEGDVDRWLNEAKDLIKSTEPFLRNDENEESENSNCKVIFCSVWIKRYKHGRKAMKMSVKVEQLVNDKISKFGSGSISYDGPLKPVEEKYEEFQSRRSIFDEMMAALKSPGVTKIGVYGINGVGKTTLVKAIALQACKEQLVDEVATATVFQEQSMNEVVGEETLTPDIKRIQEEISDRLKFKFQTTTVSATAEELRKRLKDGKKKRLIILDNILVGFKLEVVGIPDDHDGCRILMTSTDENVLSREMGSKNFQLNVLEKPEALAWFKKMVGDAVKNPAIDQVANKIAEKCYCWPILLVSFANGLKYKKNLSAWDETLDQLSNYDEENGYRPVYVGLRLSLNRLKEDAKQLFLLCGQFPPNAIDLNYLLRYSRCMGLFPKKYRTLADTRRRLLGLLSDLKASSLLQEGYEQGILMMHNFVHSFVMSVQSENALMISENDLPQWSEVDLEKCTAISLYCKISELPDEFICPNLNFFLLNGNNSSLQLPQEFFSAMGKLKVLDFTGVNFSPLLPPSFESLTNLQTLCLDVCKLGGVTNMDIIGRLKNLKILSFRGSDIVVLPKEINQLSQLELLDLRECQELEEIPQTLLLGLKRLEDLHMENICLNWEVDGTTNKLSELASLTNLSTLDIHIADSMLLTMDLFSQKLERFKILIGDSWDWFDLYNSSKTLKLELNGNVLSMKGVRMLTKKVEELYLREVDVKRTSLCEIDASRFPRLKHLDLEMVHEVEYINSSERGSSAAFTMLESFYIDNLKNLKKISHGKFIAKSFGNLRVLKVKNCPALKNLFSTSMANGLSHLEELKISDCETLEEMAIEETENDADRNQEVSLPQLQKLTLKSLPMFTSFLSKQNKIKLQNVGEAPETEPLFSEKLSCPNLKELKLSSIGMEKIWQERVLGKSSSSFRNLRSMIVDGCNNLIYVMSLMPFSTVEIFVNLNSLQISNCEVMKEVIAMEEFRRCDFLKFPALSSLRMENCPELRGFMSNSNAVGTEADITNSVLFNEKVAFPNLNDLSIRKMAKLKMMWHSNLQVRVAGTSSSPFQNLTSLNVDGCDNLKYLSSFSMVNIVVNLKSLQIMNCKMMEEVIMMEGFQGQTVELQQLQNLHLENLPELAGFCSCDFLKFPALTSLSIESCPKLRFISTSYGKNSVVGTEADMTDSILFIEKVVFPNINDLSIGASSSSFQNLTSLSVYDCHHLKYLMTFSMVKNFVNLKSLKISYCEMLKEVIVMDGFQEQIVLQHLEDLTLEDLPEFAGFCSCNLLNFPALVSLLMNNCPALWRFMLNPNAVGTEADMTDSVLFNEKVAFPNLDNLSIVDMNELKMIWHNNLHENSFCNLSELEIWKANKLQKVFPSSFPLTRLQNLETLKVSDCETLDAVFDTQQSINRNESDAITTKLRELSLSELPNLRHIWTKETLDILSFQNIQTVLVEGCSNLKSLFPVSLARELRELQDLTVYNSGMVKIISKDKTEEAQERFQFPQLTYLRLGDLPELKRFYSGRHTVECPDLDDFTAECDKVEIFISEQGHLELRSKPSSSRQSTEGDMIAEETGEGDMMAEESTAFNVPSETASEISSEDKISTLIVPGEQVPNNLAATEHSDYAPPSKHETSTEITVDEQATSTQFEEDTAKNGLSQQSQKHPQEFNQNEQPPDDVSASFNQQASTIHQISTTTDSFAPATVTASTMSTPSKESNYMASMPNSETPFQLPVSNFHALADIESLLASTEDLLKQHQELSYYQPSSSSVTGTDIRNPNGATSKNYLYSMDLIKKILKKNLTEVARTTDAHHLLINLINLKNSPILNSHQVQAIQDYIENFDSLVAYHHPSYEQQIDMVTSALVYSIEEKRRSIANLNALYNSSTSMSRTLGETKKALKKMLHETEAEENRIRASTERVYADLVAKKGELETDVSVLSKAKSRQQEVAEKARKANDSWEKLRNLFT